jgi:hypothetical protein
MVNAGSTLLAVEFPERHGKGLPQDLLPDAALFVIRGLIHIGIKMNPLR